MQIGDVQVYAEADESTRILNYGGYMAYFVDFVETMKLTPTFAGYTNFAISPALPEGITLNPVNGVIMGQLTSAMVGEQLYHVNATDVMEQKVEETSFTLSIRSGCCVLK